ncbi:hypothetical protein HFC70_13880 [Agrobacterium sp. a22-2]|uniref:hypothetical protein n=1 Tax=Agrobacterium sp. a22-2 TaxID=2283840 RepID=UPI0014451C0A|nr:hypothetical protein [Agrobacterium sp. a22-2]NKN37442.1 hypothetical protein [Agrobacterium sp. a22-2]
MANAAIIGVTGEPGLWLADFTAGTIVLLSEPLSGELAAAASLREQGLTVVKGIDFAVAVSSAAAVASSHHEG